MKLALKEGKPEKSVWIGLYSPEEQESLLTAARALEAKRQAKAPILGSASLFLSKARHKLAMDYEKSEPWYCVVRRFSNILSTTRKEELLLERKQLAQLEAMLRSEEIDDLSERYHETFVQRDVEEYTKDQQQKFKAQYEARRERLPHEEVRERMAGEIAEFLGQEADQGRYEPSRQSLLPWHH